MTPIVYVNGRSFVDDIMNRLKTDETRTRNMLRALVGLRVYIAETGSGPSMVRCSCVIKSVLVIRSRAQWDRLRRRHRVPEGSRYDWKPETKVKYLYRLTHVRRVNPFHPPEGVRHGRVWMEYNND